MSVKVNEVEVKVDEDTIYFYCDDCVAKLPDFVVDTKRVVLFEHNEKCDGCGKELTDDAES